MPTSRLEADLVYTYRSPQLAEAVSRPCPTPRDRWILDTVARRRFRAGCNTNSCSACLPRRALKYAWAISNSLPTHALTLTRLPGTWVEAKEPLGRFRMLLRAAHPECRHVFNLEHNPSGDGSHAHFWLRGRTLDFLDVKAMAVEAGIGSRALLEHRRQPSEAAVSYALKSVIYFDEHDRSTADAYLELNDGRFGKATPGFWTDRSGRPAGGWRAAAGGPDVSRYIASKTRGPFGPQTSNNS